LVRHKKNVCPYNASQLKYYKRNFSSTLSGPSTLCTTGTYTLSAGSATSWSVAPSSAFTVVSSNGTSAVVKATTLSGQSGTLTATVNGVPVRKSFTTCNVTLSGPSTVCDTGTYTLAGGSATAWSVTPSSAFSLTSYGNTSATVKVKTSSERAGTITAIVNGIQVQKTIQSCKPYVSGHDICTTPVTFEVKGLSPGTHSVTWTFSNNLKVASTNTSGGIGTGWPILTDSIVDRDEGVTGSSSITLEKNSANMPTNISSAYPLPPLNSSITSEGWVQAVVGGSTLPRKYITVGTPPASIWGPGSGAPIPILVVPTNVGNYIFQTFDVPSDVIANNITWVAAPVNNPPPSANQQTGVYHGRSPSIYMDSPHFEIRLQYLGVCGYSVPTAITMSLYIPLNSPAPSIFPNPASSIIHFKTEVTPLDAIATKQQIYTLTGPYIVRLISIPTGILAVSKTISSFDGNYDLDVSTVPDGLYSLILIQDNTIIHTQTILIAH
jgi:hypothetical protein